MITSSFRRFDGDYAGQHVYAQALGLSRKHDVFVIYPTDREITNISDDRFHRCPFPYPFKTYPMAQVRGPDLLNVFKLFTRMREEIKAIQACHSIDLFYAFWVIPSGFICSITCNQTPLILGLAGADDRVFGRGGIARPFMKHTLGRAAGVIALSNDLKSEAMKMGAAEEKITVIPSGIDTEKYKPGDKDALRTRLGLPGGFLLVYAGSLFKLKRVDWLIRLSARLGRDFPLHALIIGDGPEKQDLEALAARLNTDNVHFLGNLPYNEVPPYLSASDVLVLFSETEGLPSCVQEGLSCGLPVVATGVGGIRDIVHDGENGYVVESEDEAGQCLTQLLGSSSLMSRMRRNARAFAEDYLCIDRVVERVNAVCESVSGSGTNHPPENVENVSSPAAPPPEVPAARCNIGVLSTFPLTLVSSLIDVQLPYADQIHVIAPDIKRDDVHFHPLKYRIGSNLFSQVFNQVISQFRMSWKLAGLREKTDFWIFAGGDVFLLPVLTARLIGKPVLLSVLGNLEYEIVVKKNPLNPVLRFLRKLNLSIADRIIFFSRGLPAKWGLANHKDKYIIAQSQYVDLDRFRVKQAYDGRKNLAGYLGRLSPEKGVWDLVKSLPVVLRKDVGLKFVIIGDGPLYGEIRKYLEAAGIENRVRLAGRVPYAQVPDLMNELRLLVMPSYSEGLPSTLLEAMACGTPVLATLVGAVGEVIAGGKTGFLLADNTPETIARGIELALNHPEVAGISDAGRKLVEQEYSLSAARRSYATVIREAILLSGRRNRSIRYQPGEGKAGS